MLLTVYKIILFIVSCISTFIFIYLIAEQSLAWLRLRKVSNLGISTVDNKQKETFFKWLLRNGVSFLNGLANWLISKSLRIKNFVIKAVLVLSYKNIDTNNTAFLSTLIGFGIVQSIITSLIFRSSIAGIAVFLLICACVVICINSAIDKREEKLKESIPEAMRSMSACFSSGYTLLQTFEFLEKECTGDLKEIFSKCSNVLRTGGTIPQALEVLKGNNKVSELVFVSVALDVQHKTGGSISPVINSAKDMIESRLDLMRKLKVQTAQAKLSAKVVTILPFALIACFSILSPDFLTPFFSSVLGFLILLVAVVMQASGVLLVRRMLNVQA